MGVLSCISSFCVFYGAALGVRHQGHLPVVTFVTQVARSDSGWRTRAAQAWHPQNRALCCTDFSTTALPSTGGGQFHDHRARWFSLVASGQVELQSYTGP